MIETELQQLLYEFMLGWLANDGYDAHADNVAIAASVISWALFGTAMQYRQDFSNQAVDALAARTVAILIEGL